MPARLILNGKKADRPDVPAAVRAVRDVGHALDVRAICNGRQAGGGQPLAPAAVLDDGLLDVISLRTFPPAAVAQVVAEMLANRDDGEYVARIRTPWIKVWAPAPIPVNLDGEPISGTSFRFVAEPGCIQLVLPGDCPCVDR